MVNILIQLVEAVCTLNKMNFKAFLDFLFKN